MENKSLSEKLVNNDHIQPMTVMDKPLVLEIAKSLPQFFTEKGIRFTLGR